jgi:tight adherence protein C
VLALACAAVWLHHLLTRRRLVMARLLPPPEKARHRGLPPWLLRLVRAAAPTGERYAGAGQRTRLEQLLLFAGHPWGLDLTTFLGLRMVAVFAGMALGVLLSFLVGMRPMLVLMAIGYFAPGIWLKGRAADRQAEIAAALPDFLDTLAVSLRAGVGLYPALKKVAGRFGGPLGAEFTRIVEQIDMGVPMADALRSIRQRTNCRDLELCIDSLTQSLDLGVPVAATLAAQAAAVRRGRVQRAKEKAAKASPKITLLTTFLVTPGVFLLLIGMVVLNMYYHPERYGIDFLLNDF